MTKMFFVHIEMQIIRCSLVVLQLGLLKFFFMKNLSIFHKEVASFYFF